MPSVRSITEAEAVAHIQGICFKTGPPRRIGVELEWLVHDSLDPLHPVGPARLSAALADLQRLPLRSSLSQEPGGQLELSSAPANSLTACVQAMAEDLAAVRDRLEVHQLRLAGHGLDPWHAPRRVLQLPRYSAMEEYFDRAWPLGRAMMCSTASVQVCLDAGTSGCGPDGYPARWRLAHRLGPVLVAAFANSPLSHGRPTGLRCTRQAIWSALDPARTLAPRQAGDPRVAWARYALEASVLCVHGAGRSWQVPKDLTFRDWIRGRSPRPPTLDDVSYHLTTLFPPVRPRGHLELRMIDAQPGDDGWIVPLAVTTALIEDLTAAEAARRAVLPLADRSDRRAPRSSAWRRAARHGLADPALREAAEVCFAAAREALPRLGASLPVREAVDAFSERYVARGRCPADDLLGACAAPSRAPSTPSTPNPSASANAKDLRP